MGSSSSQPESPAGEEPGAAGQPAGEEAAAEAPAAAGGPHAQGPPLGAEAVLACSLLVPGVPEVPEAGPEGGICRGLSDPCNEAPLEPCAPVCKHHSEPACSTPALTRRRFSEPREPLGRALRPARRQSDPEMCRRDPRDRSRSSGAALSAVLGRRAHRLQSFQRGYFPLDGPVLGGARHRQYHSEGSSVQSVSPCRSPRWSLSPRSRAESPGSSRRGQSRRPRLSAGSTLLGSATPTPTTPATNAWQLFVPRPAWCESAEDIDCFRCTSTQLELHRVDGYLMDLDGEDFKCFKAALLANCLCMAMNDREVLELARNAVLFGFVEGEEVVCQGDVGTHFFVVREGQYSYATGEGPPQLLGPGGSFGEVPLIHGCRQLATVAARGPGGCWGIRHDAFRSNVTSLVTRTYTENVALLDRVRIFQYLDRHHKVMLAKLLVVQIYTEGSSITHEGNPHGDHMWIVKTGSVEVKVGGKRVATLGVGDHFGERALLYKEPRSATVSALEPTMVCAVTKRQLEHVLGKDFKDAMWRNVIYVAIRDLRLPFTSSLQTVTDAFIIKSFRPRSPVVREGDEARGLRFVIVLNGEVAVRAPGAAEGQRLQRGECFGEEYLSDLSRPFQHSIANESESHCKLALLSADAVAALSAVTVQDSLSHKEKMALVRRVYVFRHLSNHHCHLIANSFRTAVRSRGEKVIEEGELGSQFFVIRSGELLVTLRGRSIRTLGKSDYFGERGLLYDEPRTATVTCQSEVAELMVIDKAVFMHIVEDKMLQHLEARIRLQQTDVALEDLRRLRVLGRGTFGVVRLVEHRARGTRYALKCISRAEAARNGQQENLRLEREILLENDHPFIVKVVRTFKDHRYLYFLTELVTGGELYDIIRVIGLLSRPQAQFYMGSLVLALESLHERSIAYRDLKPENVLLDSQGFAKLIDFGCAVKLRGASRTMVGTPHYMAPEVILGTGYGLTCDVWSLGVCLYEFMCGPLPFGNKLDDPVQVFREILAAKLRIPQHLTDTASRQLARRLLRRPLELRIGCSKLGWRAVRKHAFFRGFSFDRLLSRQLEPPLVPPAPGGEELEELEEDVGSDASGPSSGSALTDVASEVGDPKLLPIVEGGWDKDF